MIVTTVLLAAAGGIGASLRFVLDGFIQSRARLAFPVGTTVINVTGSLLLGVITGLAVTNAPPEQWHLVIGTGFLGGYTTFSTASLETVRLIQARRFRAGLANGFGVLILTVAAAGAGMWLGSLC